jgi:amidase
VPEIPELCALSATAQRSLIESRTVSSRELTQAHLDWIDRVNPAVNAICTLVPELALSQADAVDAALAAGEPVGALAGLPAAIKDLVNTKGVRTTHGSPLFAKHVPGQDALHVARMKAAGAVLLGKTNTPEWGAGSQTFNPIFGATATPYDLNRTSGGSSGGAAAALAARMLPVADGSDLGGSLRNPAAFCNVVGLRPSMGRVPAPERVSGWNGMSVLGPMGRTVEDVARLLSVMAGADPRDPLSRPDDPAVFAGNLEGDQSGKKVAFSEDLGFLPVAEAVRSVFRESRPHFESLGCVVDQAAPDLKDAPEVFQILRAHTFAGSFRTIYESSQRDKLKDTVRWNVEKGLRQSGMEVARAEIAHTTIYRRVLSFFEDWDFLVLPATQVLPFPKDQDWVREIEGVQFENYLQWMEICSVITVTGCPSISIPCGFSPEGLPVGLQIVGPPLEDLKVLKMAHAFEAATGVAATAPSFEGY